MFGELLNSDGTRGLELLVSHFAKCMIHMCFCGTSFNTQKVAQTKDVIPRSFRLSLHRLSLLHHFFGQPVPAMSQVTAISMFWVCRIN